MLKRFCREAYPCILLCSLSQSLYTHLAVSASTTNSSSCGFKTHTSTAFYIATLLCEPGHPAQLEPQWSYSIPPDLHRLRSPIGSISEQTRRLCILYTYTSSATGFSRRAKSMMLSLARGLAREMREEWCAWCRAAD